MLRTSQWDCSQDVKEIAYTTLVRPKVKYASQAWDPSFKKDIASIERVQRKAARFCTNNYHPFTGVTDMVNDLGWTSLELRGEMSRLILMYKMSRGLVNIDVNCYLRHYHSGITTRGSHNHKFTYNKGYQGLTLFIFS